MGVAVLRGDWKGPGFTWEGAFEGSWFAFGLCSPEPTQPRAVVPLPHAQSPPKGCSGVCPPCPAQPYLGEPVLVSEVGPDRGSLRLALGKLGISLHPVNHTGWLPGSEHLSPDRVPPISSAKPHFPTISSPPSASRKEETIPSPGRGSGLRD